jgi:hypothetical protein
MNSEEFFTFILENEKDFHIYRGRFHRPHSKFKEGEIDFEHIRKISCKPLDYQFQSESSVIVIFEDHTVQILDKY